MTHHEEIEGEKESDNTAEELDDLINNFLQDLCITAKEISDIERQTVGQSSNPDWYIHRSVRLTASTFGKICCMRSTTCTSNTVKAILYPPTYLNRCKSLEYGRKNELNAVAAFENEFGVSVQKCGLFIDDEKPFLAASPDGLIGDDAILEIKCPWSAREYSPREAVEKGIIKYLSVNKRSGRIRLKENHVYMYQVQGQLHITKRNICYFVMYTDKGIVCDVIKRKDDFWKNNMEEKLEKFYKNALLPEIVDSRVKRNLPIRRICVNDYSS